MTAGLGVIHRELAFRNERAHALQLWVNLPGRPEDGRHADFHSGKFGDIPCQPRLKYR